VKLSSSRIRSKKSFENGKCESYFGHLGVSQPWVVMFIQGVMTDSQIKKSSKLYAQAILPMGCPIMDNNSDFLGVTILNLSIFVFGP
jgi:hypothetical protein